jgi:hypothetical protein
MSEEVEVETLAHKLHDDDMAESASYGNVRLCKWETCEGRVNWLELAATIRDGKR